MTARQRRFALAGMSYAFLVTMFGTTLPTPLYPIYQAQFGISELMVTVIYAVYAVGVIAALIVLGRWSDQLGRRPMLFAGLAFSVASAIVFVTAGSLTLLLLGRVLSGISAGIFTGTATVAVVEAAPPSLRGRATLLATAMNMGGLGLGPLVAGLLAEYVLWPRRLVFVLDIVLLGVAALGVWYAPETGEVARRPRLGPQRLRVPAQVRAAFVPACIAGFAGFAVTGFFTAITPAFLGNVLKLPSLALVGAVVFAIFAASTLGQAALGRVPGRLALPGGCIVLAVGAGLVGVSVGTESLAWLVAGAVLSGFGQGLTFRSGLGAITEAIPEDRRSEITSTFFVILYVALSIPVVGVGLLATWLGLRVAGMTFAAAVGLLALVALVALLWMRRRSADTA